MYPKSCCDIPFRRGRERQVPPDPSFAQVATTRVYLIPITRWVMRQTRRANCLLHYMFLHSLFCPADRKLSSIYPTQPLMKSDRWVNGYTNGTSSNSSVRLWLCGPTLTDRMMCRPGQNSTLPTLLGQEVRIALVVDTSLVSSRKCPQVASQTRCLFAMLLHVPGAFSLFTGCQIRQVAGVNRNCHKIPPSIFTQPQAQTSANFTASENRELQLIIRKCMGKQEWVGQVSFPCMVGGRDQSRIA